MRSLTNNFRFCDPLFVGQPVFPSFLYVNLGLPSHLSVVLKPRGMPGRSRNGCHWNTSLSFGGCMEK